MVAKVSMASGAGWIKRAVGMVMDRPGPWIGGWAATFGAGLVLSLIPVVGSALSQLLHFVMTLFFFCYANAQIKGVDFDFDSYFEQGKGNVGRLVLMTLITLGLILLAGVPLFSGLISAGGTDAFTAQAKGIAWTPTSIALVIGGSVLTLALLCSILAATLFTTPLILFQNQTIGNALRLSLKAAYHNKGALILYGIFLWFFFIICALPLLMGLLIAFPAMTASFYLAYEEILGKVESV